MEKRGNIIILSFTQRGYSLSNTIAEELREHFDINIHRVLKLNEFIPSIFTKGNVIIFVGAVGIAVRAIAPLLKNKTTDPAVIVIDELGRFVIPILSGHIGGANDFANKIADLILATPVLTTATDINDVFQVDTFAIKNNYAILNPEAIKYISSSLLEEREVGLCTPFEIAGELPKNIVLKDSGDIGIFISSELNKRPFRRTLHLLPKCFHIGIGARKNISFESLEEFLLEILSCNFIQLEGIATLSSIDLKKDEDAIVKLSKKYNIPFLTYSIDELKCYEGLFSRSDFVKNTIGIGNVCEISAYVSSKRGKIICNKTIKDGITIAIAEEAWRVSF